MDQTVDGTASRSLAVRIGRMLGEGTLALRAWAGRGEAWLAVQRRSADDARALARMNAHELRDIGIDRPSVHVGASGVWTHEYPR